MPNSNYSEFFWLFGEIGSKVPMFFTEHAQQMFSCAELPLHSDPGVYHFILHCSTPPNNGVYILLYV